MCLFPYPVAEVRAIADAAGAYLMYDAAQVQPDVVALRRRFQRHHYVRA